MDEDVLNQQIRKFLKKVGISSQREIEKAVRSAVEAGRLGGGETLHAAMTLEVGEIDLRLRIEDRIKLA